MRSGAAMVCTVLAGLLCGSRPLIAQGSLPCGSLSGGPLLIGPLVAASSNLAFTATIHSTAEMHLADGNTIRQSGEATRARDGNGRTMEKFDRTCGRAQEEQGGHSFQVMVTDREARTTLTWIEGPRSTHIAYLRHQPEPGGMVGRPISPLETFAPHTPARRDQVIEPLGTRTLAGLQATGTRTTRIIASGAEGNDLPLKVVQESWVSQNPRTTLMTVSDDPRFGHRVWEVTSLKLAEPDASLFAPPSEYKLEEAVPSRPVDAADAASSARTPAGGASSTR